MSLQLNVNRNIYWRMYALKRVLALTDIFLVTDTFRLSSSINCSKELPSGAKLLNWLCTGPTKEKTRQLMSGKAAV